MGILYPVFPPLVYPRVQVFAQLSIVFLRGEVRLIRYIFTSHSVRYGDTESYAECIGFNE